MSDTHPLIMDILDRMWWRYGMEIIEKPDMLLSLRQTSVPNAWLAQMYIPDARLPADMQADLLAANPQFIADDTRLAVFHEPNIKVIVWHVPARQPEPAYSPADLCYFLEGQEGLFTYDDMKHALECLYDTINPMLLPLPDYKPALPTGFIPKVLYGRYLDAWVFKQDGRIHVLFRTDTKGKVLATFYIDDQWCYRWCDYRIDDDDGYTSLVPSHGIDGLLPDDWLDQLRDVYNANRGPNELSLMASSLASQVLDFNAMYAMLTAPEQDTTDT